MTRRSNTTTVSQNHTPLPIPTVLLEQRVQTTYGTSFIKMTKKRRINRPSRIDRSRISRTHCRPSSLSGAYVYIVAHATTIPHRPAPTIRKHTREPSRIQHSPMVRTVLRHAPIRYICNHFQRLGQHCILVQSCRIFFCHRTILLTTRLHFYLRSQPQAIPTTNNICTRNST